MAYFGTDLDSAYPTSPRGGAAPSVEDMFGLPNHNASSGPAHKLEPIQLLPSQRPNVEASAPQPPATSTRSSGYYDPGAIHQQMKYEQEIDHLKRELQRSYETRGSGGAQVMSSGPSLFESLWARRRDMLKSVIFALLILLGIALHTAFDHVLKKYIIENDLTGRQETLARFAYPLGVAVLVWLLKVLNK